jgi:L-amino acid N-acyltransferase YncA
MNLGVFPMQASDWEAVCAIYSQGIATGDSTFETLAPDWEKWDRDHLPSCRLVARSDEGILGWAALSAVSTRPVYSGVAEASLYVATHARRKGVGRALLSALIQASENEGIWTVQAGIFPGNIPSLELCKRAGFRVVGVRERLGRMQGRWRDVVFLERRSGRVGYP